MPRVLTIAGIGSGAGKTTVALGLMSALRRRGAVVQPFKVGPDYIDPSLHAVACGRPSINLDGWMTSPEFVRDTFAHHARGADFAIIEGVMGLFDGKPDAAGAGSTAQVAVLLGSPVLLVLDAAAMGPTLAAVVRGVENFDLKVEFAGVVLNRVGSVNHADVLRAAAAQACRTPVIGTLHRRADIEVPSRHLGLAMGHEGVLPRERLEALADAFESAVSLESLLAETAPVELPAPPPAPTPGRRVRVALARDGAFCFYYEDNLRLLADAGAEWVEFSPLHDRALPANVAALYLGGGYPELHAAALSANEPMQAAIRAFVEAGRSVWAECGGLMYLGESLTTVDGAGHRMAGVLPIATAMQPRRQALRYFSVRAAGGHPLLPEGAVLRGHEFHYSKIVREPPGSRRPAYRLDEPPGGEGFLVGGTAASYIHVHLGADPALAPAIVERLARGNR